jgi:hypothetical protein
MNNERSPQKSKKKTFTTYTHSWSAKKGFSAVIIRLDSFVIISYIVLNRQQGVRQHIGGRQGLKGLKGGRQTHSAILHAFVLLLIKDIDDLIDDPNRRSSRSHCHLRRGRHIWRLGNPVANGLVIGQLGTDCAQAMID